MKVLILFVLALYPLIAESQEVSPGNASRLNSRPPRIPPPEVQRGERVAVTVLCGAVQVKFDAETESSAHIGETVIVRNPENGRRFIARVEEAGKVVVKK
jgi:hypothetical protein